MVSSLKASHSSPLELWTKSKDFLHVFTDAVNHIPRHRRTKFFTHLVAVLGTDDFLAPVSMLLVEKVANRIARQSGQDSQSSLELPITLVNSAPLPIRIKSLVVILEEAERLVTRVVQPEDSTSLFLSPTADADANTALPYKRRAQALITFVGSTFTSPLSKPAAHASQPDLVVKGLVALATLNLPEPHLEITKASLGALNRLLNVLSALDFVHAVASMMEINDERVSV
jgi:U3 small nucleolar RNA-associated protein 10